MADLVLNQGESVPQTMQTRYRDMGDGTHSMVVALGGAGGGSSSVVQPTQQPTITAGAYAAGDNVGGLLTFAGVVDTAGEGAYITSLVIVDDASQSAQLELWLFDRTFTAGADNAAWAPTEADLENLVGVLSTDDGTWYAAGATGTVHTGEHMLPVTCQTTALYGRLVVRDTPTYAATDDLTVRLGVAYG